ncbi:MAG: hypothetical protein HY866_19110 [Chloroflexi bacterium]|nr:hypothetical protein [Chloroflexota bacterium]
MTDKLFKASRQPEVLPDDDHDYLAADERYEPETGYFEDDDLPLSEAVPRSDPLSFIDEQQRKLALALDFGPEDLMFNDEGKLSPAQIALLDKDVIWLFGSMIALCGALALFFAVLSLFVFGSVTLLPALAPLLAAFVTVIMLKRVREQLPQAPVQRTTLRLGTLSLTARRWGLSDDDKLPVPNHQPIFAPKHLYKALQANRTYILYYTPLRTWRGYRLLSLEPTEDAVEFEKSKRKPKRG